MIASYNGIMDDVLITIAVIAFAIFAVYIVFVIRDLNRRHNKS